jgi:uncharacterized membrane protein required for colicin V production
MTIAGFHFGIIDISLIVLSLLFAISGFKNGFLKEVVGFGSFIGAIILAYVLANWVEDILVTTPLYTLLFTNLNDSIFTGNALYDTVIDSSQPGALGYLTDGLVQIGLPGFLASPLADILITFNGTLGAALATASAYFVILIISYLGTFLIAWLLLAIVGSQLVKLSKDVKAIKFVDSLLGVGLGLGRAAVLVAIALLIVIPLTFVVPGINDFMTSDLALNEDVFSLGKFIYTFVLEIVGSLISI